MKKITIPKPFNAHSHPRIGEWLKAYVPLASRIYCALVAMGNLPRPVKDALGVRAYRSDIIKAGARFELIMTQMLVNSTTPRMVEEGYEAGARAIKLIPGGASTNSEEGVALENLWRYYSALEIGKKLGMPFLGHWELPIDPDNGQEIPEWLREVRALSFFQQVIEDMPGLTIIGEHASTKSMIDLVKQAPGNIFATLTLHHSIITYEDVFDRPIGEPNPVVKNPFLYCKPVAKSEEDRRAVVETMISGDPKFFFGPDTAPHPVEKKTCPKPAAGICTLPEVEISKLCEIFDEHDTLENFSKFVSENGRRAYGLEPPKETLTLLKDSWVAPEEFNGVRLFLGGQKIKWRVVS